MVECFFSETNVDEQKTSDYNKQLNLRHHRVLNSLIIGKHESYMYIKDNFKTIIKLPKHNYPN